MTSNPPLGPLRSIVQELQSSGLQPTLGGSGLLRAHGLVEAVHDWDVLVDVDRLGVEAILQAAGLRYVDGRAAAGGRYASSARLLIEIDGEGVDLIVEFAIWPDVCRLTAVRCAFRPCLPARGTASRSEAWRPGWLPTA